MMNRKTGHSKLGFAGDHRVPYSHRGWEDARNGVPFDYRFADNAARRDCALAYETARYRVLTLQQHGIKVPQWNDNTCVPTRVRSVIKKACEINQTASDNGNCYWTFR